MNDRRFFIVPALAALVLILAPSMARSAPPTLPGATSPATFAQLSSGDQKVAHALFLAQQPAADGLSALDLDQIAALRGRQDWRRVFAEMKNEKLVTARSLAQVMRDAQRVPLAQTELGSEDAAVLMTSGNGRMIAVAAEHDRPDASDGAAASASH